MGRIFGLISVIVVVGIGGYIYTRQVQSVTSVGTNPETTVDMIAVRNDLMAIANAQRRYWATNARYASLDELRTDGDIEVPSRDDFVYSIETSAAGFNIVAIYSGTDPDAPRRISINEAMTMRTE
ncbi:MAG TPA: hypothetical protein VFR18_08560 [Terriglobia bacterium]|nr:hypothetical protein [Terriglobia bacterium]